MKTNPDDSNYLHKPFTTKTKARIARALHKSGDPLTPLYIRILDPADHQINQTVAHVNKPILLP